MKKNELRQNKVKVENKYYYNLGVCSAIVKVVKKFNKSAVIKIVEVITENSNFPYFTYLCGTNKTMNASYKYLSIIQ
jgi:hypothetical protein